MSITLRPATRGDCPDIALLVRELARYEKLEREVALRTEVLEESLFGPSPRAFALLAKVDGAVAGFCIYFYNFSTFLGRPGLYIEDIFVRPQYRSHGIGKRFFALLAEIARDNGCGRMEWSVLDWNKPAIDFYARLGARPVEGWTVYRLTEDRFALPGSKTTGKQPASRETEGAPES